MIYRMDNNFNTLPQMNPKLVEVFDENLLESMKHNGNLFKLIEWCHSTIT